MRDNNGGHVNVGRDEAEQRLEQAVRLYGDGAVTNWLCVEAVVVVNTAATRCMSIDRRRWCDSGRYDSGWLRWRMRTAAA